MPYLTRRALEGLSSYAYKPSGYTFLDELHQPVWNYITEHWLPMWLAPNLITLMGLAALLASYATGIALLPDFVGASPRWFPLSSALAVFFYLHMDCLDGKQARRTRNSSPLGQLFDHGCDALAVHLILMNVACSVAAPMSPFLVLSCAQVMVTWVLAHWEEYHTGTMVYGNGYFGVTEANYSVVALHLVTWAITPQRWLYTPFAAAAGSRAAAAALPAPLLRVLAGVQCGHLAVGSIVLLGFLTARQQIARVFRLAGSKQLEHTTLPKREHGHKQLGRAAAAAHLAHIAALFAAGGVLLLTVAPAVPGLARVSMGTFGVLYALQATQLIMAHMAKEPYTPMLWPLFIIGLQISNHYLAWVDPLTLGYSVCAVAVVGYVHYVICLIREICAFLHIPCLTVRKVVD